MQCLESRTKLLQPGGVLRKEHGPSLDALSIRHGCRCLNVLHQPHAEYDLLPIVLQPLLQLNYEVVSFFHSLLVYLLRRSQRAERLVR